MTLTLLLDLDDTLLNTNLKEFIPAYFQALSNDLAPHIAPDLMMRALIAGTRMMNESEEFSRTLEEVFAAEFYSIIGGSRGELDPEIENFYDNVFPTLGRLTTRVPEAVPFVDWALSRGYRLAIATDPLLPRKATHHRLRWAGFEPGKFELVSTFEDFHFSKTHPAYYAEVLGRLGWPEGSVLMVGNDMERDIRPAQKLGLATYHIVNEGDPSIGGDSNARGDLAGLRSWLEKVDHSSIIPSYISADSVKGILNATPAVLRSMTRNLDGDLWLQDSSADEWSVTELICHLRDTETEIHHMQLKLFAGQAEPFIPRPDTGVWASQRDYLHEKGMEALLKFVSARSDTMDLLKLVPLEDWSRKARHAIFGPTNFLEVVRFISDHDRLHIQQAWRIMNTAG